MMQLQVATITHLMAIGCAWSILEMTETTEILLVDHQDSTTHTHLDMVLLHQEELNIELLSLVSHFLKIMFPSKTELIIKQ